MGFGNKSRSNNSGGGKSNFDIIGNVSVSKSTQKELGEDIVQELQESNIKMGLYITIPKGQEVLLEQGDQLLVSLQPPKGKDKEWVVGKLLLAKS